MASDTDWDAIEVDYRAGQFSVREIARQHGITEGAIRHKAKDRGWTRHLADKVAEAVRTELVRADLRMDATREAEIIESAAAVRVAVVRGHRKLISKLAASADMLAEHAHEFLTLLREKPDDDAPEATVEAWRKAVADAAAPLGPKETIADLVVKASQAAQRLIPLERQAFSLDESQDFKPGAALVTADQARRIAEEYLRAENAGPI